MKRQGLGAALEAARLEHGLSREVLARELNLSPGQLEAIESEAWERLPAGLERPLTRQVAKRLGVDPEQHGDAWESVPGAQEAELPDPRRELLERTVMGALTLGSLGLLLWLVVPGPGLRTGTAAASRRAPDPIHTTTFQPPPNQPYPVLGEVVPEAALTEEGVLVSLRALDSCRARITSAAGEETRVLQVSEPWRLRVKGGFTLWLENAGVVKVEVAGRPVVHGQSVGEVWEARFGPEGNRMPAAPVVAPVKAKAPETDPEEEGGPG